MRRIARRGGPKERGRSETPTDPDRKEWDRMQGWSWMAALALAAAPAAFLGTASLAGQPTPIKQTVKLSLRLDGIAREQGEVVIKPGHSACRFKEISFRVVDRPLDANGMINLDPFEVETISADRDCAFVITLKEPGKPDKTVRRNLFVVPNVDGRPAAPQKMTCFVSADPKPDPVAGRADETKRKK
jgi:hypothetical protein